MLEVLSIITSFGSKSDELRLVDLELAAYSFACSFPLTVSSKEMKNAGINRETRGKRKAERMDPVS